MPTSSRASLALLFSTLFLFQACSPNQSDIHHTYQIQGIQTSDPTATFSPRETTSEFLRAAASISGGSVEGSYLQLNEAGSFTAQLNAYYYGGSWERIAGTDTLLLTTDGAKVKLVMAQEQGSWKLQLLEDATNSFEISARVVPDLEYREFRLNRWRRSDMELEARLLNHLDYLVAMFDGSAQALQDPKREKIYLSSPVHCTPFSFFNNGLGLPKTVSDPSFACFISTFAAEDAQLVYDLTREAFKHAVEQKIPKENKYQYFRDFFQAMRDYLHRKFEA